MKTQVADAIRRVTAKMQKAVDAGQRSIEIDANDLVDVLMAVADEIDPPTAELVDAEHACPGCGERHQDRLVWQDDETVLCSKCGMNFVP